MNFKSMHAPKVNLKKYETRIDYDDILKEKEAKIKELQMKLMVLSKGYFEIREHLKESDEKIQDMTNMNRNVLQVKQDLETLLKSEKSRFESEKAALINSLPTLAEMEDLRSENRQMKERLSRDQEKYSCENVRLRKKNRALTQKVTRFKKSSKSFQLSSRSLGEKLAETQEALNKTVRLNEEGSRKKLSQRNRLQMRVSQLTRTVREKEERIKELDEVVRGLRDKNVQVREWARTLEVENSKTHKEFLGIQEKMYRMENELQEEYQNSQLREALIEKLRGRNFYLRQSSRNNEGEGTGRDGVKDVNDSQISMMDEETLFLQTIRGQVGEISTSLKEAVLPD